MFDLQRYLDLSDLSLYSMEESIVAVEMEGTVDEEDGPLLVGHSLSDQSLQMFFSSLNHVAQTR